MSFAHTGWASGLEGVTPIARLIAFWLGNRTPEAWGKGLSAEEFHEESLEEALGWIGCTAEDLTDAFIELEANGMTNLAIVDGKIRYRFPDLLEQARKPDQRQPDLSQHWIYVISGGDNFTKVGITGNPDQRLAGLQSSNPSQKLTMLWKFSGPRPKIRKAEQRAHALLAEHLIRNEWFSVTGDAAIAVVKLVLDEVI